MVKLRLSLDLTVLGVLSSLLVNHINLSGLHLLLLLPKCSNKFLSCQEPGLKALQLVHHHFSFLGLVNLHGSFLLKLVKLDVSLTEFEFGVGKVSLGLTKIIRGLKFGSPHHLNFHFSLLGTFLLDEHTLIALRLVLIVSRQVGLLLQFKGTLQLLIGLLLTSQLLLQRLYFLGEGNTISLEGLFFGHQFGGEVLVYEFKLLQLSLSGLQLTLNFEFLLINLFMLFIVHLKILMVPSLIFQFLDLILQFRVLLSSSLGEFFEPLLEISISFPHLILSLLKQCLNLL